MKRTVNAGDLVVGQTYYDRTHGEVRFMGRDRFMGINEYNFLKVCDNKVIHRTIGGVHREIYTKKPNFIHR